MNTFERLDALRANPPLRLTYPAGKKVAWGSDSHYVMDPFMKNYKKHLNALEYYFQAGFVVVFLGDHRDLWRFDIEKIAGRIIYLWGYEEEKQHKGQIVRIGGNHDYEGGHPEAAIITVGSREIFCAHGHQGEWINDEGWELGKLLVRYGVAAIENLGIDVSVLPGSDDRHARQRVDLLDWANSRKADAVFGHIHHLEEVGYYRNCGSGVELDRESVEFLDDGQFHLAKWTTEGRIEI